MYTVQRGSFAVQNGTVRYYASVDAEGESLVDPPEAPGNAYRINMLV